MEVIDQRIEYVGNLNDVVFITFYQNLIAAGNDFALGESRGQLVDVLVFYAEKVDEGDVLECNAFFDQ